MPPLVSIPLLMFAGALSLPVPSPFSFTSPRLDSLVPGAPGPG